MDTLLQKLIDWFASASPQLWAILIRQVYTRAIVDCLWVIAIVCAILLTRQKFNRWLEKEDSYDTDVPKAGMWFLWILGAVFGLLLVGDILMILINPEYQAIQLILGSLK